MNARIYDTIVAGKKTAIEYPCQKGFSIWIVLIVKKIGKLNTCCHRQKYLDRWHVLKYTCCGIKLYRFNSAILLTNTHWHANSSSDQGQRFLTPSGCVVQRYTPCTPRREPGFNWLPSNLSDAAWVWYVDMSRVLTPKSKEKSTLTDTFHLIFVTFYLKILRKALGDWQPVFGGGDTFVPSAVNSLRSRVLSRAWAGSLWVDPTWARSTGKTKRW